MCLLDPSNFRDLLPQNFKTRQRSPSIEPDGTSCDPHSCAPCQTNYRISAMHWESCVLLKHRTRKSNTWSSSGWDLNLGSILSQRLGLKERFMKFKTSKHYIQRSTISWALKCLSISEERLGKVVHAHSTSPLYGKSQGKLRSTRLLRAMNFHTTCVHMEHRNVATVQVKK